VAITNVVVVDAVLGIRKVSIDVRAGRIVAVGRAGNPDTCDDVDVVLAVRARGRPRVICSGGRDGYLRDLDPAGATEVHGVAARVRRHRHVELRVALARVPAEQVDPAGELEPEGVAAAQQRRPRGQAEAEDDRLVRDEWFAAPGVDGDLERRAPFHLLRAGHRTDRAE
jgi:hypothetical protein